MAHRIVHHALFFTPGYAVAVSLLSAKGFPVRKIREGVSEWQATGMPVEAVVAGGEVHP